MDFKLPARPAVQHGLCGLFRADQRGHRKTVFRGQRRLYKAGVHHGHGNTVGLQVQVQIFSQVNHRGLGGPIGQAVGQAAVTRHTGDQTDMPAAAGAQRRKERVQNIKCALVIYLPMAAHFA